MAVSDILELTIFLMIRQYFISFGYMSIEIFVVFLNDFNGFSIRFVKIVNLSYLQRGMGLTIHYLPF